MTICNNCGKEYRGYEDLNTVVIDGLNYCLECAAQRYPGLCRYEKGEGFCAGPALYRVSHTFSSLFDGPHEYMTSLDAIIEHYGPIRKIFHCPRDPMLFNWGFGLTGHIDSEHYEIYVGKYWGFHVYEPPKADIEKMKAIGIMEGKE